MTDMLHLDFTGVQVGFDPIPDGIYPVVVQEVQQKTSRAGNAMLALRFAVQEPEEYFGRLLFANYSLLPQALWKLRQLLEALDPGGDYTGALTLEPDDLFNLEMLAVVDVESYVDRQGQKAERNRLVTPLPSTAASQMPPAPI